MGVGKDNEMIMGYMLFQQPYRTELKRMDFELDCNFPVEKRPYAQNSQLNIEREEQSWRTDAT